MSYHGHNFSSNSDESETSGAIPSIAREDIHALANRLYSLHNNQSISDLHWKKESTHIVNYLSQFTSKALPLPQYAMINAVGGQRGNRVAMIHLYLNVQNAGGSERTNGIQPRLMLFHHNAVTSAFGNVMYFTHDTTKSGGSNVISLVEGIDGFAATSKCLAEVAPNSQTGVSYNVPRILPLTDITPSFGGAGVALGATNLGPGIGAGINGINGGVWF